MYVCIVYRHWLLLAATTTGIHNDSLATMFLSYRICMFCVYYIQTHVSLSQWSSRQFFFLPAWFFLFLSERGSGRRFFKSYEFFLLRTPKLNPSNMCNIRNNNNNNKTISNIIFRRKSLYMRGVSTHEKTTATKTP